MKILSIYLSQKPAFVLVQKNRNGYDVLDSGVMSPDKQALFKKADVTLVEIEGVRFIRDPRYSGMDETAVREKLMEGVGGDTAQQMRVRVNSSGLAAALREGKYSAAIDRLKELNVTPMAVYPKGVGISLALRKKHKDGLFIWKDGERQLAFVLENNALKYCRNVSLRELELVKAQFPESGAEKEITAADLGLNPIEPQYLSLVSLALNGGGKIEKFDFIDTELKEKALEPRRMRRSITIAGALVVIVALIPVYLGYQVHGLKQEMEAERVKTTVMEKRLKKIQAQETEALQAFQDILKLTGTSAGGKTRTEILLAITQPAPASISITDLNEESRIQPGEVGSYTLSGQATDLTDVFAYEANLKKSIFKESKVIDTRKVGQEGKEIVSFRMEVK